MHTNAYTGEDNFKRLISVYDLSCVTADCLMIKKSKYLSVDELDEKLKVDYNDVNSNLNRWRKDIFMLRFFKIKLLYY